jgi:hypothetical protein
MKAAVLEPEFVEYIPEQLDQGRLYVSMKYATVCHSCCCGCGAKVVTPLSPAFWKLSFDGEGVSLYPSIGNWESPCESHYWIKGNRVIWDRPWSRAQIDAGRKKAQREREAHFQLRTAPVPEASRPKVTMLERLRSWLR